MSPAIRLLMAVVAALLALMSSPAGAQDLAHPVPLVHGYTYDAIRAPVTPTFDHVEGGPPADGSPKADGAVGHWWRGASARPYRATTYRYTDFHRPLQIVVVGGTAAHQSGVGPATTNGNAQVADGALASFQRAGVAANNVTTGARTCLKSFTGDTLVLMADGVKKPIKDLEVGDRVIATDPETGERVSRRVTWVWVHEDQVLDLVVDGETITTTEDHPFWSVTDQQFERADELAAGEVVLGDGGREITVSGFRLGTERAAIAYNLSIAGVHTYHVGDEAILVHNTCGWTGNTLLPSGEKARVVGGRIWGHGTPSATRLEGLSPDELRGLASHDDAVMLRNWYAAADEAGTGGSTAGVRVTLAETIIDAWYVP